MWLAHCEVQTTLFLVVSFPHWKGVSSTSLLQQVPWREREVSQSHMLLATSWSYIWPQCEPNKTTKLLNTQQLPCAGYRREKIKLYTLYVL